MKVRLLSIYNRLLHLYEQIKATNECIDAFIEAHFVVNMLILLVESWTVLGVFLWMFWIGHKLDTFTLGFLIIGSMIVYFAMIGLMLWARSHPEQVEQEDTTQYCPGCGHPIDDHPRGYGLPCDTWYIRGSEE